MPFNTHHTYYSKLSKLNSTKSVEFCNKLKFNKTKLYSVLGERFGERGVGFRGVTFASRSILFYYIFIEMKLAIDLNE